MPSELVINATLPEVRVALLEDGEISDLSIEYEKNKSIVGNVYKGRIVRVLPGMQAAFVDIGLERAAFLYVGDIVYDSEEDEEEEEAPEPTGGPQEQEAEEEGGAPLEFDAAEILAEKNLGQLEEIDNKTVPAEDGSAAQSEQEQALSEDEDAPQRSSQGARRDSRGGNRSRRRPK
jgi:Rne/Rng family ribonuclease